MAYSVNYLTFVVTIPKSDLTLISASPEIYELNVVTFWQTLHDLQDDLEGVAYPAIMRSNPPVTLSGTTEARIVEVINGWSIEFEDGQYQVDLIEAKSNILDVRVQNQVSINNKAGILVSTENPDIDLILTRLTELWQIHGLDIANAMTVTPSSRVAGSVSQTITGDGENTTTVTRT